MELMVGVALVSIMMAFAIPSFRTWIANSQVRTASEALQSAARLAQAEASRRYRQVVLFRTASSACTTAAAADANGGFWALRTVALAADDAPQAIECGKLTDGIADLKLVGPTAVCFNAAGRPITNANPGVVGANCQLPPSGISSFDVTGGDSGSSAVDRPLRILISLGGSVRMCDPSKVQSSSNPDGCPASP
ncbi:hypothetical protein AT984_14880 [Paucibacter sp. KCTC 42545]|nr:hypothetical protein AT984_14880 [Paucibacter sp. KCTC 42545]